MKPSESKIDWPIMLKKMDKSSRKMLEMISKEAHLSGREIQELLKIIPETLVVISPLDIAKAYVRWRNTKVN